MATATSLLESFALTAPSWLLLAVLALDFLDLLRAGVLCSLSGSCGASAPSSALGVFDLVLLAADAPFAFATALAFALVFACAFQRAFAFALADGGRPLFLGPDFPDSLFCSVGEMQGSVSTTPGLSSAGLRLVAVSTTGLAKTSSSGAFSLDCVGTRSTEATKGAATQPVVSTSVLSVLFVLSFTLSTCARVYTCMHAVITHMCKA